MQRQEPSGPIRRIGYSLDEAATATGLSRSTLKRLEREGKLFASLIRRRKVIPVEELERLVREGAV